MINIREIQEGEWPRVWEFMKPVVRSGESYPYAMDMTSSEASQMWLDATETAYVVEDEDGELLGSYYIKPNQPTLGAHVANCGYVVAERARRRGIAVAMCEHSQEEALRLGYRAMQFNLVVAPNKASVNLWTKMGFTKVGILPGAFKHARLGFVDAFIMYKVLLDRD